MLPKQSCSNAFMRFAVGFLFAVGALLPESAAAAGLKDPNAPEAILCRSITIVLNEPETKIRVITTAPQGSDVLIVRYVVDAEGKRSGGRTLVCAFGNNLETDSSVREIIAVTHDGRALGPARLTLLKRYWLKSLIAQEIGANLPIFGME
jgi:hypothetical protein